MKKNLFLLAALLCPIVAIAGSQADYQDGINFTQDPTGGQNGGKNASNLQNLIQLYLTNKNLDQTTGAQANSNLNSSSQSAQDINILRSYFNSSNSQNASASTSLNQSGGRGDQKKQFCRDYIDPVKTPNPDPTKYAECQAVVELDRQRIKEYRAATGFSRSDSIFSAGSQLGQAKKMITDTPQDQLLTVLGVGTSGGGSGQQCVTVNKTSPPQTTQGQCARAAIPDSTPCEQVITPKVFLEKFCNASGGATGSSYIRATPVQVCDVDGWCQTVGTSDAFWSETSSRYQVSYRCGPKDLNGDVTTIYARVEATFGPKQVGGCGCPGGTRYYDILFAPGVSTNPASFVSTCRDEWHGNWGGCSTFMDHATTWYNGVLDTVFVSDIEDGVSGVGYLNSCKPGTNFVATSGTWTTKTCVKKGFKTTCTSTTDHAVPAHCETPSLTSVMSITPTITTASGTWKWICDKNDNCDWAASCPAGYLPGNITVMPPYPTPPTCYMATYTACPIIAQDSWVVKIPPTTGYTATGAPNFPNKYCTRQSAINDLWKAAPLPHYDGGAGIRARLKEEVTDTCAQYQNQSPNGPVAAGGSYPPITKTVDTCPTGYELITAFSAADPAYCRYQPPDENSVATVSYTCPNGGTVNTATLQCEIQDPSYSAIASKLYTCPAGDTLKSSTCPNGGTKSGQSCLYKPTAATITSETCDVGYTLLNHLCYNDISLAATVTAPNGSSVLDSMKTYSCSSGVLNGAFCEPVAQVVECEHQPPSVPSYGIDHYNCPTTNMTGSYLISYAIADNTVQNQSCIAFPITKPATLQRRHCNAPYTYNSTTDKCEYQMADYNSTLWKDCADTTYTYNATSGVCEKTATPYNAF